jgi:hypothetical protein
MARRRWIRDVSAIALLTFGVVIFTVGWLVGAVMLWSSPTWRVRDKILGTLVFPGGLPFAIVVAIFGVPAAFDSALPGLATALEVLLIIGPIYTAVHLFRVSAKATGPLTWRRTQRHAGPPRHKLS